METVCDICGGNDFTLNGCPWCGAPICCQQCCKDATKEALDELATGV